VPGNYTSDGSGIITITDITAFGGPDALAMFPSSAITNNSDGTITVATCGPIASGACPEEFGYTCRKKDDSKCGIQFSSPSQAQWCAVPVPSSWPAVLQVGCDTGGCPWLVGWLSPVGWMVAVGIMHVWACLTVAQHLAQTDWSLYLLVLLPAKCMETLLHCNLL
jgi:hypothetical protein